MMKKGIKKYNSEKRKFWVIREFSNRLPKHEYNHKYYHKYYVTHIQT
jgi:hypothetical protein